MLQPRFQGLSSLPSLSFLLLSFSSTTKEAKKRDPGNEVGEAEVGEKRKGRLRDVCQNRRTFCAFPDNVFKHMSFTLFFL